MKTILILMIVILIIYFMIKTNNEKIKNVEEQFTALSGIESPLTTYDDYGTFNFIFHIDDLPYYDPTYDEMACRYGDFNPKKDGGGVTCGSILGIQSRNENFNKDSFIDYQGFKVRRELVPSNYSKQSYMDADFDRNQLHLVVKKDRPQASAFPPQPFNIYFNKIQRVDEKK